MINKNGIMVRAMWQFRNNPEYRVGQALMNATFELYPNISGPVPPEYNCWNDDLRLSDFLEWANWAHDLRVLG